MASKDIKVRAVFEDKLSGPLKQAAKSGVSDMIRSMTGADKAASGATKSMTGASDRMKGFAAGAAKAGVAVGASAAATAGLTLALGALAAAAGVAMAGLKAMAGAVSAGIQQAKSFQAAMQEVKSLQIAEVGQNFQQIRSDVLQLASTMGIDAVDAAKAAYNALSAGIPAAGMMDFLRASATGAVGGISSLADVGSVVATVMNTFGASAGSATQIVDTLFGTVKAGVTTMPELAASMGNVATNAAAANVTLPQTAAALASLTQQGFTTSKASTALNQALIELQKPGDALSGALGDVTLAGDGLDAVLAKLTESAAAAGQPVSLLFSSSEAGAAIAALAADESQKYSEALDGITNSAGAAQEAMDIINESWDRQATLLKGQVVGAITETAMTVLDMLAPALSTANDWLGIWLPQAMDIMIDMFGRVVPDAISWFSSFLLSMLETILGANNLTWTQVGHMMIMFVGILSAVGQSAWAIMKAIGTIFLVAFRFIVRTGAVGMRGMIGDTKAGSGVLMETWKNTMMGIITMVSKGFRGLAGIVRKAMVAMGNLVVKFGAVLALVIPEFGSKVGAAMDALGSLATAFDDTADDLLSARRSVRDAFYEYQRSVAEVELGTALDELTPDGLNVEMPQTSAALNTAAGAAGQSAGREAGSAAASGVREGAKESLMADLAKKFAEAWSAGIKAIADIMGADLPALETLQPKLAIIESFFVDLGLRIQAAARVLDPKDDGSGLKTITDAVPAIKGAVEAFKAAADLARSLVDMVEVNTAALDSLVPLLESARDHAVKMATLNEAQAEAVKRFADTMKPVIEALSAAAQLDLGTVTRLTQEQLDTARMNMADAFVHVMNLSAAFRALSVTAQEDLVQSSARFSASVGEVVKTIAAAAKVNLAGVTRVMSEELDTVRLNIVDMWMTVAHVSAAFRQLVADAQDNLVAGFARFAEAVGAIGKTVAAVGALNLEGVTRFAADQMETIRLNILDMWMSFAHLSAAFRALSPQQQSDIVDGFARFGEAVKAITGTLKAILEIPPPAGMEGQGATGGDGSYVLRRSAFGWTMSIVEGVVSQSKMLINMLDRAIGAWDGAVNPRVKLLADAVGNVTGLIKNLLELPAKAADFKATEAVGGDGAVLLRRTALGWTADMIEGMVGVAILLVDMVDRAIGQWEREVNPRVKALSDAVSGVTDLIANLVELPVPPEMARAGGSFLVVQWTQDVINHLVGQATLLIAMLDAAIGQWEQNVDSKIGELAGVVGDTLDLLDGIVNMPPPPEMAMAGGSFLVAEWSEALVHHLIDQAKRMVKIVRDAVGAWDDGVSQAVKDLAEATGDAMTLLQAAFDIGEMGLDGIAEVSDHAIETAARQIRKVVEGLGSLIGDAEGQVSSDLVAKAKELGEAFQPVAAALSGVGEMIMAIMSNPFYSASRRVAGARTSAEFAAVVSKDRLSKRIADAIRMMIQTVLDAVAGVTIDPKLGDRFQPLVDAAERIRSAFDTLSGLTLPADLDKIIEAARKLAGFGSGGGGGLGTMRWADLEYFGGGGGGGGVSVARWADLEYFGGAGSGVSPMRWADLEYFGGGGGFSPMRWADLEYFGAGGAATTGMQPGAPITLTGPVTFQGSQTVEVSISGETIQRTAASGTFDQARNRRAQTAPTA